MVELLTFLASQLSFLFGEDGFRFVDSRARLGPHGDAMVTLESRILRLRVVRDRMQLIMSFQPVAGKSSEWFSPGLLRGLLSGDQPASEVLDEGWATYLSGALPTLEERLADPGRSEDTLRELRKQAKIRSRDLFG